MEFLGNILMPYKDILGKLAETLTSLQIFSGLIILNTIRKSGSTKDVPVYSFLIGTVMTTLSLRYGLIINDNPLIKANLFRLVLSIIYLCIYYYYTPNNQKLRLCKALVYAGIFLILCNVWSMYEDDTKIKLRFGILLSTLLITLFLLPFIIIIRNKSSKGLPFPMIVSATLVFLSWTLYGLSTFNRVLVIQNATLLSLALIQLTLFAIYPAESNGKIKSK